MKTHDIIIFLSLFALIVIATVCYPLFAVEYFSTFHDLNIDPEKDINVKKNKKEKKEKSFMDKLSMSNIFTTSDPEPCECCDGPSESKYKNLDDTKDTDFTNMLDKATYHSSCCPSTYSSSNGCACLTPEMKSFLNNRGNNKINLI